MHVDHMTMQSLWNVFCSIVTIVATLIGIWKYFTRIRSNIIVEATPNLFQLPKNIESLFSQARAEITEEKIDEIAKNKNMDQGNYHVKSFVYEVYRLLNEAIPSDLPYEMRSLRVMWNINISNKGDKIAEDIQLIIPDAKVAFISRVGEENKWQNCNEIICFNTMRPREEIKLLIWCSGSYSIYAAEEVSANYKEGVCKVISHYPAKIFWAKVSALKMWQKLYLIILISMLVFFAFFIIKELRTHENVAEKSSSTNYVDKTQTNQVPLR
jgi:hypothetical protein